VATLLTKKHRFAYAFIFLVVSLSLLLAAVRYPVVQFYKYPLYIVRDIRREIAGLLFFHSNLIRAERAQQQIDSLNQKLSASQEIYLENQRLKDLLSLKQNLPYKITAAQVVGRSADNWASLVFVNKGKKHGIRRGQIALTYAGLAGRVVETGSSTATVMLINDPGIGVSAIVQRSRQEGLITGTLGGTLIMKYLPKDADIEINDSVVTSGLTDQYPKGLIVGTVVKIKDEFSGLSKVAYIKPASNLGNIEEVLLLHTQSND
jgi:rod shape-determining protein MreC